MIEELEVEIIKQQKLNENVNQEMLKILRRNLVRNEDEYIIYTDGAANVKAREETLNKNMGIGWIQTNKTQEWPEEEMSFGVDGWSTLTIAELVAIWAAILTILGEKQIRIYTDSNAAIRNISRGLEQIDRMKILKKKNAIWITKIIDLINTKKIKIELVKVKSHSKNKWNDKA